MNSSTYEVRYRNQYFFAFIIIVIIVWSPFKAIANIGVFIFIGAILFLFNGRRFIINETLVKRLLLFVICFAIILSSYWLIYPFEFLFLNAFFSLITYSLLILVLCVPSKGLGDPLLIKRMGMFLFPVVIVQSIIGLLQATAAFLKTGSFDGMNGDVVEGTLHLPLESSLTFSNPLYSMNLIVMLVFLIYVGKLFKKINWILFAPIAAMAILLASVMHLTLLIIFAFIANSLLSSKFKSKLNVKNAITFVTLFLIISISIAAFQGENMTLIRNYYEQMVLYRPTKVITLENFFINMPKESLTPLLVGTGPGQFSSKASMLLSSTYIESDFFGSFPAREITVENYLIPFENTPKTRQSALHKPFFSVFSIITEFGLIGFFFIILLFRRIIKKLKKIRPFEKNLGNAVLIFSYYTFFCGFLEFYWETPHAMILLVILIKPLYAYLNDQYEKSIAPPFQR